MQKAHAVKREPMKKPAEASLEIETAERRQLLIRTLSLEPCVALKDHE